MEAKSSMSSIAGPREAEPMEPMRARIVRVGASKVNPAIGPDKPADCARAKPPENNIAVISNRSLNIVLPGSSDNWWARGRSNDGSVAAGRTAPMRGDNNPCYDSSRAGNDRNFAPLRGPPFLLLRPDAFHDSSRVGHRNHSDALFVATHGGDLNFKAAGFGVCGPTRRRRLPIRIGPKRTYIFLIRKSGARAGQWEPEGYIGAFDRPIILVEDLDDQRSHDFVLQIIGLLIAGERDNLEIPNRGWPGR